MFDKIYAINLDRRPDRWRAFMAGYPAELPPPIRWSATDGLIYGPPASWPFRCKGCWGCRRSHESLLRHCVTLGIESVLIHEDDARPVADFASRWRDLTAVLPGDWQICYLGGNLLEAPRNVSTALWAPGAIYTAHAVAFRGATIPFMADRLAENRPDEINPDVTYSNFCATEPLGVYCAPRWLFDQRDGYSDIRGAEASAGVFVDACDYL